jgi:hypothetical protein
VNTGAPLLRLQEARQRVLEIQTKLHQWANDDGDRRFSDLHNLVCDPAFLAVAWSRVKGNKGARTAGVDGIVPRDIAPDEQRFLTEPPAPTLGTSVSISALVDSRHNGCLWTSLRGRRGRDR